MTVYYSNASDAPTVEPGRLPSAIGVTPGPDDNMPIGIAYEAGRIGGYDWENDRNLGPVEAVWRIVVGREDVEGRFALRGGVFVALADDAE
jgi:hypothetical protein